MKVIAFTLILNILSVIFYPIAMHRAKRGKGPWLCFILGAAPTVLPHLSNLLALNFNVGTVTAVLTYLVFTAVTVIVIVRRRRGE